MTKRELGPQRLAREGLPEAELQSVMAIYGVDGSTLSYETAPRYSQLRRQAAVSFRILRDLGFNSKATRQLVDALRTETARDRIVSTWPTAGDDRKALIALADAAIKLRQHMLSLSPKAVMYLHSGAHDLKNDDTVPDQLLADLFKLAACAHYAVQTYLPKQSRKGHHANVVEAVARVSKSIGVKISDSPTSRFWRACVAAFELADITSDFKGQRRRPSPGASIRAFLDADGHRRHGKFWHLK